MTAIAAIWTPKRVVLAGNCRQAGDIWFALSCLDRDVGFDAAALLAEALEGNGRLDDKMANFAENVETPLQEALQRIFNSDKEGFKARFSGRDALGVVLFGRRHGEIFLSQTGFVTKMRGKEVALKIRHVDYPDGKTTQMSVELVTAGLPAPLDEKFRAMTTEQQALVYPEKALQSFMAAAHATEPLLAAYPLPITKFSDNGAEQTVAEKPL